MPRRNLLLNVGFWTLFGALQAGTWLLGPIGDRYSNPYPLIAIGLFNAHLWALLTPFIFPLAARINRSNDSRIARALFTMTLGLGVAAAAALTVAATHDAILQRSVVTLKRLSQYTYFALNRWYFEEVVLFFLVFAAGVAVDMLRIFHARERESARLHAQASLHEAERAELAARLASARLALLRSQLNPHFLFNTLNAVSALVVKDPAGVRSMISLLSELLRYALTDTKEEEVPLHRELAIVQLYLRILEIRYQGQLRTVVIADLNLRDALVPGLILQPLVENAMKHGVAPAGGDGVIEIRADRDGDYLVLTVADSGSGSLSAVSTEGTGVGLRITRERLSELYGEAYQLHLENGEAGMVVRIVLPYHTLGDVRMAVDFA